MHPYTTIAACRSCGGSLTTALDLGSLCINAFPAPHEPDTLKAPLELTVCKICSLAQLRHTVDPDLLFRTFFYRSSVTKTMREAMGDIVKSAMRHVNLVSQHIVVDIGSNDGTLLRCWPRHLERIGFDPAENLAEEASEGGNTIITDYFTAASYSKVTQRKATVITAAAMFYDLDKPAEFLADVKACLADNGIFICQISYLPAMLDTNDFPSICHEHLTYYSLTSLLPLFDRCGLHVYDIEFNNVNGGSIRVFADHGTRCLNSRVEVALLAEKQQKLNEVATYHAFGERVYNDKMRVISLLNAYKEDGPVYLLAASTKGNTIAQYYGFTTELIAGASDRDPRKVGLHMVGTRIPIVDEETGRKHAKTFFCNAWYFRDEIVAREKAWLADGGRIVFAQPKVHVVGK